MSEHENNLRKHTAEEIAEGINPTFKGMEEVANTYDKYIGKEDKEK